MGKSTRGNNKQTTGNSECISSEWEIIFDSITDLVSVLDADRRFIRVNRPFAEFVGVEPQDLIGEKCHKVMHGTDTPAAYCPIARSTSIRHPIYKEVYDSTLQKHFMISLYPIMDEDGKVQNIVHVMRDITDNKKAEIALTESMDRFRGLVETTSDWIWEVNEKGLYTYVSPKILDILGYKPEEVIGKTPFDLMPPEESKRVAEIFYSFVASQKPFKAIENTNLHKKGHLVILETSGTPFFDGDGILRGFRGIDRDITDRKKTEVDLIIKNRAIESSLSAIGITNADGKLLYVNDSLIRMWGYGNKDEVLGKSLNEFWEGDRVYKTIENTIKKGGDVGEDIGKRKNGSVFDVQFSLSLIKDNDGQPQYFFCSFLDISEQKKTERELKKYYEELEQRVRERTLDIEQINEKLLKQIHNRKEAEEAVRESEMRFRVAATTVTDLLWEGDVRDNSLNWHGDIDKYLGYDKGEFPRTISGHMESIHPDDREWFINSVEKALETGKDFRAEYRIRCKDGTYRYWDESGKAIAYENGKAVKWIGCVIDITDRKNIENQIISSENLYKKLSQEFNALLDAIPDNIVLLDSDLNILWANRATSRKFNEKSSRMKGQHCYDFYRTVSTPCENCPAIASFDSGREETARMISASGEVWDIRAFPIKNDDGHVKSVIEVARDVSLTVKLEKEAAEFQARLIQTNKMTSLGTLVAGVAHEINNPNSFIMTNADLFNDIWKDAFKLLNKLDDGYKQAQVGGVSFSDLGNVAPRLLRGIYDGSGRIKNMIDNLRDFSRAEGADLDEKVDVNEAVRAASNMLNTLIKKHTDNFYLSCRDDIPFIKGNSQQIEQVVINLIMNSLQALTDRESCIIVSTYHDSMNDDVMIKVEDEGTGISELIMQRITEPFFTTRMESGGTGLGLSISYAIIKDHKGSLEFTSEQNKRTVALIKLPACSDDGNGSSGRTA